MVDQDSILEPVCAHLDNIELPYMEDEQQDRRYVVFSMQSRHGDLTGVFYVDTTMPVALLRSWLRPEAHVPTEHLLNVALLVTLVNFDIGFGHVELDLADGELRASASIPMVPPASRSEMELWMPHLVQLMIMSSYESLASTLFGIEQMTEHGADPVEAHAAVRAEISSRR